MKRLNAILLALAMLLMALPLTGIAEAPAAEEPETAADSVSAAPEEDPLLAQLTAREREVLDLIGGGYSNRDIAKILFISEYTVNDHTKKIYRKLNVHSRHAAAQIINRQMMHTGK